MQTSGVWNATATGLLKLGQSNGGRDGYLYVPPNYAPSKAVPLVLALHADGRNGLDGLAPLFASAKASGGEAAAFLSSEDLTSLW